MLGPERFLQENFDQLCLHPGAMVDDIITIQGVSPDQENYQKSVNLPKIFATKGRYQVHDLKQFDPEDIISVEAKGFEIKL